jgi:hypothetical protein
MPKQKPAAPMRVMWDLSSLEPPKRSDGASDLASHKEKKKNEAFARICHFPKVVMVIPYPPLIGRDGCDGASSSRVLAARRRGQWWRGGSSRYQ